ncbi:diaminopimelate decarboxylase [Streptomyces sp. NPDC001165]|uniref:diaminopimelate decarboxylase n=1 Tax=Streptomyces sp. NPDC001165 TaxID=3364546 RepID=UPI0036A2BE3A
MSEQLVRATAEFGTPLWAYDSTVIRERIARLSQFDVVRYAQKANSNTHVLRLMRDAGVCVDAVSLGELERAFSAGYRPEGDPSPVVFTADLFDRPTLRCVADLKIPVNAGSADMLEQLGKVSPGHPVWMRINPGFGHGHSNKTNTGGVNSKHGIWHEDLRDSLRHLDTYGLDLVGLHMHIGSGVDYGHLESVCEAMLKQARLLDHDIRAISAGGGLTVPYGPGEAEVDVDLYFTCWDEVRRELESELGHRVHLEIEPGRYLVANSGTLVCEVRAEKHMGPNRFVLVDAGFNDLMRPALYGSEHRVSVLAPDGSPRQGDLTEAVLAGPLCESGDIFTQRADGSVAFVPLPPVDVGDLVVFHDAGAYGASMSSNYNSRPLAAEVLLTGDDVRLIRRRQSIRELIELEE